MFDPMKFKVILILALATLLLAAASAAQPQVKLLCVSQQTLRGEETVNAWLAKGERFAVVDQYGLVRIPTPEEVELSRAFNPKLFETRAFGIKYFKEAPSIPPLPVPPEAGGD
ncbi:MAG: succinylglutamate desuccinylase [Deltaproteobacteria bacterium]|nr:succinylglutamate desuccinylase [Deltaproteobacteria bacterium]